MADGLVAGRDPRAAGDPAGLYLIAVDGGNARALTQPPRHAFIFPRCFLRTGAASRLRRATRPGCVDLGAAELMFRLDGRHRREPDCNWRGAPTDDAPVDPGGMAWSRDGKSILFVAKAGSVEFVAALGRRDTSTRAVELAGSHAEHPATVTVARPSRVLAIRLGDASLSLRAGEASSSEWRRPHRSKATRTSRRTAAYCVSSGRSGEVAIWVAAADGLEPRQLTSHQWTVARIAQLVAGRADDRVRRIDPDGHVHVWTIPAEGGTPRRITKRTGDQTVPTWSRDGKWIYFSEARDTAATSGERPQRADLRSTDRTGAGFLAYETADGANLLYQPKYGDSPLLMMPLEGGGPPRLLSNA